MRYHVRLALAAIAAAVTEGTATAGPLLIAPTTVQFEPDRHSAAIEITNASDSPVDLQFRAYAWAQVDGREVLTATEALAISPPIATLPPRGKQVFRVLDRGPEATTSETSYRLKINELPRIGADAVAINLEFSLPAFRTPVGGVAQFDWSPAGTVAVRLANRGTRRLRISELALEQADGTRIPIPAASSVYLLAGATRSILLPPHSTIDVGTRLRGMTDTGPIDVPLAVLASR